MGRSVVLLALLPSLAYGWGFEGHRRLASLMQDPLPADHCLRDWYRSLQSWTLQDHACDPDRWRYTTSPDYDPNEWPRHFLEVDWVTPISAYPRDWDTAVAQLHQYATQNGIVPWRVEELYGQLVAAYRTRDPAQIGDRAFLMSHYVTDSFSVLHDTKNADPNNGLHSRWESDMLSVPSNLNGIAALAFSFYGTPGLSDPRNNVFDVVIVGNGLVAELIAADSAHVNDPAGFYLAVKELTARRWGDALTLLASMLWSAWVEAGSPELPGFTATCSRAPPTSELVLRGYPPLGGFVHDAGWDAGQYAQADAGADGGLDGGDESDAGVTPPPPPGGCGCSTRAGSLGALFAAILLALRRRSLRPAS